MRDIPEQITMLEGNEAYSSFVEKFKPKKTTDDCFTPPNVYRAVLDWVIEVYGISEQNVCRPFYPGGDFERYGYEAESVVVDNPPFSILKRIIDFYNDNGIKYFLFAPHLTNFGSGFACCHVIEGVTVTYENGAEVSTSFVTNLDDRLVVASYDLYQRVDRENKRNLQDTRRQLPKYEYPLNVLTAARVGWIVNKGVDYELQKKDACFIRGLDAQRPLGKAIFGGGFLLSEKAAAEKAAAEKAAAEKAAAERFPLSEREQQIIKLLGGKTNENR